MSRETSIRQTYCAQFEIINNTPICTKCGKYILTDDDSKLEICKCGDEKNYLVGWQCPVCGEVMSPFRQFCINSHYQTKLSNSTTNQEVR